MEPNTELLNHNETTLWFCSMLSCIQRSIHFVYNAFVSHCLVLDMCNMQTLHVSWVLFLRPLVMNSAHKAISYLFVHARFMLSWKEDYAHRDDYRDKVAFLNPWLTHEYESLWCIFHLDSLHLSERYSITQASFPSIAQSCPWCDDPCLSLYGEECDDQGWHFLASAKIPALILFFLIHFRLLGCVGPVHCMIVHFLLFLYV